MSESFDDNLDAEYLLKHECEDMQIMEGVRNVGKEEEEEEEEFRHIRRSAKFECVFCIASFQRKRTLLRHMREEHGILQPYQCMACSKRFATYYTLWRHRRSVCRRNGQTKETGSYTHSAFISGCQLKNWTPIFGNMLPCVCIENDYVAVFNAGKIAGYVPQRLSNIFTKFLHSGTINARIAGAVIDRGYGLEIPVDYIFHGEKERLHKIIERL